MWNIKVNNGIFIVNFDISHLVLVFFFVNFKQVNAGWDISMLNLSKNDSKSQRTILGHSDVFVKFERSRLSVYLFKFNNCWICSELIM